MGNDPGYKNRMMTADGYLLHHRKSHLRVFDYESWQLDEGDKSKLIRLAWHMNHDNALGSKRKVFRPYTLQQLGEVVGLTPNRMYEFKKRLSDAGIIRQLDAIFYLSPIYVMKGKRLSLLLYTVFETELDPHLTNYTKQLFKQLQEGNEE